MTILVLGSVDCLGRIPYASVIAFIMVLCGAGIMCGTLYEGVARTDKLFKEMFFTVPEMWYVQIAGIAAAGVIVAFAIILLIFGVLATGATQGRIYRGDRCILGGRCSASMFICLSYLLNLVWIAVAAVLVVPVVGWLIFKSVCMQELDYWSRVENKDTARFTYNFNLTNYGIYRKVYTCSKLIKCKENINTAREFEKFCGEVDQMGPLFACSLGGAVFVILGLVFYIAALSLNYVKLKLTKELTEYRKANELNNSYEMNTYTPPVINANNPYAHQW